MFPHITSPNYKDFQIFRKLYGSKFFYTYIHKNMYIHVVTKWIATPKLAGPYFIHSSRTWWACTQGSVSLWDQHDRLSLVSLTSVPTVRQAATWIIEDIHMKICVIIMPNNTRCHLRSWKKSWPTLSLTFLMIYYCITGIKEKYNTITFCDWLLFQVKNKSSPPPPKSFYLLSLADICQMVWTCSFC